VLRPKKMADFRDKVLKQLGILIDEVREIDARMHIKPKYKLQGKQVSSKVSGAIPPVFEEEYARMREQNTKNLGLWKQRVETLILRIGGEKLLARYNKVSTRKLSSLERILREDEEPIFDLEGAINFLTAIKEDVELFGDKESEKEAKRIKKHFEAEVGIPGVVKTKWGAKEE